MRAVFCLIIGRAQAGYCLGILADRNAPCADKYLTWDEVKTLDHSGLVEIGAHTIDHIALAAQNEEVARHQINDSKKVLEDTLGHTITTFAYPYGSFNATTIKLVEQAGFTSAVSTIVGFDQSLGTIYKLKRARDPNKLP